MKSELGPTIVTLTPRKELRLFMVAGEPSGDALGGKLMAALNGRCRRRIHYLGVGGPEMGAQGLISQFPLADVAVMGPGAIVPRLPKIVRRIFRTVNAAVAAEPDAVVIIDSPEFTHPIAKRIRRRRPLIAIIDYVSPSVWAWRAGRARKMKSYIDHVLALLPFEPAAHVRLGGPPCTYVGHPLSERIDWIRAIDPGPLMSRLQLAPEAQVLVVLPGSRASEVTKLIDIFGYTVARLLGEGRRFEIVVPILDHVRGLVEERLRRWPQRPHLVQGDEDKYRAFKLARAALAASGTVTLELAITGTPMVVAYKVDAYFAPILRRMIRTPSVVLANLVLGENVVPEFLQQDCTPRALAVALGEILSPTPTRLRQIEALKRVPNCLAVPAAPSESAANIVLEYAQQGRTANCP
jgi:lipid-A-disaccharide synthase